MKRCYEEELRKMIEVYGFEAVVSAVKKCWNEPHFRPSSFQHVDGKNELQLQ